MLGQPPLGSVTEPIGCLVTLRITIADGMLRCVDVHGTPVAALNEPYHAKTGFCAARKVRTKFSKLVAVRRGILGFIAMLICNTNLVRNPDISNNQIRGWQQFGVGVLRA